MNYLLLGGFLLALSTLIIRNEAIWTGFVLLAASPPAVAVVPFTDFLRGDRSFSLLGSIGSYLAALVIMPLMTIAFLGTNLITPTNLLVITLELILIPLLLSRVLLRTRFTGRIQKMRGPITNWCFFVVTYTIVGLNRQVFLERPLSMIPVATIAIASTFLLGLCIEWIARFVKMESKMITSLVLMGTLKNYGLAGGLALAFFSKQTAVPSTVATVFMIVYIVWLSLKAKWRLSAP
jgi:BASS family bile acid:Na+ symporter